MHAGVTSCGFKTCLSAVPPALRMCRKCTFRRPLRLAMIRFFRSLIFLKEIFTDLAWRIGIGASSRFAGPENEVAKGDALGNFQAH